MTETALRSVDQAVEEERFVGNGEAWLERLIAGEAESWRGMGEAGDLFDDLRGAVLSGGKRLRPRFCFWGYVAVSGNAGGELPSDLVVTQGALELLHAFALIHDDVMDGSSIRRGVPTMHARYAQRHRFAGRLGEQRRYAEGMAVLVGDLAYSLAHTAAAQLRSPARDVWERMTSELVVGQYLDLASAASGSHDDGLARLVATLKSARYTVVRPLQMGALIAGAGVLSALDTYGEALGEAFQLRDDLLGVFGDPTETGKPVGEDLQEGKATSLLAVGIGRASGHDRDLLRQVGTRELNPTEIDEVSEVLVSTGAREEIERRIARAMDRVQAAVDDLDPAAQSGLQRLARSVAWRQQ